MSVENEKEKLFQEIIKRYLNEKLNNNYPYGVDDYILDFMFEYNKKFSESYPKNIQEEDKEILILKGGIDSKITFSDRELQIEIENIKRSEILEMDLSTFEESLSDLVIDYSLGENLKCVKGEKINPLNVFASVIFKGYSNEKIDYSLLKNKRYSERDIYNFYCYDNEGYMKIVLSVFEKYFLYLLDNKSIALSGEYKLKAKKKDKNELELWLLKYAQEEQLLSKAIFKDGLYQFWDDNNERYVSKFDLDFICPDYKYLLSGLS